VAVLCLYNLLGEFLWTKKDHVVFIRKSNPDWTRVAYSYWSFVPKICWFIEITEIIWYWRNPLYCWAKPRLFQCYSSRFWTIFLRTSLDSFCKSDNLMQGLVSSAVSLRLCTNWKQNRATHFFVKALEARAITVKFTGQVVPNSCGQPEAQTLAWWVRKDTKMAKVVRSHEHLDGQQESVMRLGGAW